jgi:hypothetical protein
MPNPENIEPHKFPKGKSGNPAGRKPGSRNLSTVLREMLEEEIPVKLEDGSKVGKPFKEVIIRKLLKGAADGDVRAINAVFDRTEGKPQQSIDLTTGGGEPMTRHVVEFMDYTKAAGSPAKKSKKKKPKTPKQ